MSGTEMSGTEMYGTHRFVVVWGERAILGAAGASGVAVATEVTPQRDGLDAASLLIARARADRQVVTLDHAASIGTDFESWARAALVLDQPSRRIELVELDDSGTVVAAWMLHGATLLAYTPDALRLEVDRITRRVGATA